MGYGTTKARKRLKTERILFHRSGRWSIRKHQKNTRKSWKFRWRRQCLVKWERRKRSKKLRETDDETKGSKNIQRIKHARIVEAHESTRKRLESALPEDHEYHIAEKRVQFSKSLQLGSQRDGVLEACQEQAAVGPRGSRTCVRAVTLVVEVAHTELTSSRGTV